MLCVLLVLLLLISSYKQFLLHWELDRVRMVRLMQPHTLVAWMTQHCTAASLSLGSTESRQVADLHLSLSHFVACEQTKSRKVANKQ